jgi:hypothetical protein
LALIRERRLTNNEIGKQKSGQARLSGAAGQALDSTERGPSGSGGADDRLAEPRRSPDLDGGGQSPRNNAQGSVAILPGGGFNVTNTNFKPYAVPGQEEDAHLWAVSPSQQCALLFSG